MKAILILIVTVGSQANVGAVDSSLNIRQIEFASIQSCERAAARLNSAGRRTSDYAKTFGTQRSLSGARGHAVYAEEIKATPPERMRLSGPFSQEPKSAILESFPSGLRPVRMRWHGKKIGGALNPIHGYAVEGLEKDDATAWRANGEVGRRPFFA